MSGCYLPGKKANNENRQCVVKTTLFNCLFIHAGNYTKAGYPLIVIESDKVHQAGLNCYEIATLILFYNTIPMK
jgi:hypothetical protein